VGGFLFVGGSVVSSWFVVVSGWFAVEREFLLRDHMHAGLLFAGRVGVRRLLLLRVLL
jgi:hypothetical protein